MNYRIKAALIASLVLLAVVACTPSTTLPEQGTQSAASESHAQFENYQKHIVIGQAEYVALAPEGLRLKARIDTGAQTSSIGAKNIERFERDGSAWVSFDVMDKSTTAVNFKRQVIRIAKIKRHNAEASERIVVMLKVKIGSVEESIEVTLADREQFEFPFLIGRNFLEGRALVDVGREYIALGKED